MPTYFPDTNVLIYLGKDPVMRTKLENAEQNGSKFVIAPSTMKELTVGVVKGGATHFDQNKKIFTWLQTHSGTILDPPSPFIGRILGFPSKGSKVQTHHHMQRICMVTNSQTFDEFLMRKGDAGNVWSDIDKAPQIHADKVDAEFTELEKFAKFPEGTVEVAAVFCKSFRRGRLCPDSRLFRQHFSAAIEYYEASIANIRVMNAKPGKKKQGMYGDLQLLFYLADPKITLLTNDHFSGYIKQSPQRTRIVGFDAL